MNWARFNQRGPTSPNIEANPWTASSRFEAPTIPFNRGALPQTGAFTMGFPKLLLATTIVAVCQTALAQSPTYALGRTPVQKKSAPGISQSARPGKNSRPDKGLPKKVRCFMFGRGVRDATEQQDPKGRLHIDK